jgi:hypothetical protein
MYFLAVRNRVYLYTIVTSTQPIYDRNLDAAEVNVQRHHANLRRFYAVRIQLLLIIFILLFSFFLAESENVTNYTRAGDTTD